MVRLGGRELRPVCAHDGGPAVRVRGRCRACTRGPRACARALATGRHGPRQHPCEPRGARSSAPGLRYADAELSLGERAPAPAIRRRRSATKAPPGYFNGMRSYPAALATALTLASVLGAQNPNLERIANDHYTRTHDYDLVHQRIVVRDFNWDSTSFTGSVTSTLVSLRPAMDSVILDAGVLLSIK